VAELLVVLAALAVVGLQVQDKSCSPAPRLALEQERKLELLLLLARVQTMQGP